jgi:biotin carboxyl carrier protein
VSGSRIEETRALLGHFMRSDCVSLHVRTAGIELFVSRALGQVNPMIAAAAPQGLGQDQAQPGSTPPLEEAIIHAPHLGTLTDLATVGTAIAVGDRIATLELLGDPVAIVSDRAGTVRRHVGQVGALVEFDEQLIMLG